LVQEFCSEYEHYNKKVKNSMVFKAIRTCAKILDGFSSTFSSVRGYKKLLKNNAEKIIGTIDYLTKTMPLDKACRIFQISSKQYYRWKNKINCSASVLNLCYKTHPAQLSVDEASIINAAVTDPENIYKPVSTIFYSLLRQAILFCSLTSFYKYAALFVPRKIRSVKREYISLKASRVFEYLHIDTTFIYTATGKIRLAFVKDNKSKAILHKAILPDGKSEGICKLIQETFQKFGLLHHNDLIHIVSDDGSENKGEVLKWIDFLDRNVVKLTAQKDLPFSNSMSESLFHIFKNEFLRDRKITDEADLLRQLEVFEEYYNWNRFPIELYGYAPMEVVQGAVPEKNRFRDSIRKAKEKRYLINKYSCRAGFPQCEKC
jgi:putative transposase